MYYQINAMYVKVSLLHVNNDTLIGRKNFIAI